MRFAPMLQETCANAFIQECGEFSGWECRKVPVHLTLDTVRFHIEGEQIGFYSLDPARMAQLILGYKMGWEANKP
jgi:hypothetical protein